MAAMMENWTEFVIGIMMISTPWILGFSDISLAKWCNVLIGVLLVILSAWAIFGDSAVAPIEQGSKGEKNNKK